MTVPLEWQLFTQTVLLGRDLLMVRGNQVIRGPIKRIELLNTEHNDKVVVIQCAWSAVASFTNGLKFELNGGLELDLYYGHAQIEQRANSVIRIAVPLEGDIFILAKGDNLPKPMSLREVQTSSADD